MDNYPIRTIDEINFFFSQLEKLPYNREKIHFYNNCLSCGNNTKFKDRLCKDCAYDEIEFEIQAIKQNIVPDLIPKFLGPEVFYGK